jgi:hypothetical protein
MCLLMKLLAIFLFAISLTAQVNSPAPTPFLSANLNFTATPATAIDHSPKPLHPTRPVPRGRSFYRWSVAILAASGVADVASSWRRPEANPVVAATGSTFGAGSVAIKVGLVGSSFLLEHLVLRHRPDLYRHLAWLNLAIAGAQGAIVEHNVSLR